MIYYNSQSDDFEYNRGLPKPMKRQKSRDDDFNQGKRFKKDKRNRREIFERKRSG